MIPIFSNSKKNDLHPRHRHCSALRHGSKCVFVIIRTSVSPLISQNLGPPNVLNYICYSAFILILKRFSISDGFICRFSIQILNMFIGCGRSRDTSFGKKIHYFKYLGSSLLNFPVSFTVFVQKVNKIHSFNLKITKTQLTHLEPCLTWVSVICINTRLRCQNPHFRHNTCAVLTFWWSEF